MKMTNNSPLTDTDRWNWLIALREEAKRFFETGAQGVVLTCSALKRKYRDIIRIIRLEDESLNVMFIYLRVDPETLLHRLQSRTGHYMKSAMIQSQLEALEEPYPQEKDVFTVGVDGSISDTQDAAIALIDEIV